MSGICVKILQQAMRNWRTDKTEQGNVINCWNWIHGASLFYVIFVCLKFCCNEKQSKTKMHIYVSLYLYTFVGK